MAKQKTVAQMKAQCPTEPGMYWAKSTEDYTWYDIIVQIRGTAPYLYWNIIRYNLDGDLLGKAAEVNYDYPSHLVFGPKVERPDAK